MNMSKRFGKPDWISALVTGLLLLLFTDTAQAQFGTVNQIGGIEINASGVLNEVTSTMRQQTRQQVLDSLAAVSDEARQSTDLRAISLRAIEAALQAAAQGVELTDEIRFMAGIQRIHYVIVQPENQDILLAGPGEGWTVDAAGNVVGETTGRPVIRLEDFIVALRTADAANRDYGISVSIDPTKEGLRQLAEISRRIQHSGGFQPEMKGMLEQAMGPQDITLTGLPADSRMAQVLVAADYRMKRIAMGFEPAAVEGIPSVLELAQQRGKGFQQDPRFWLQCQYDSITRSEDGKVWRIEGPGARALTENAATGSGQSKEHPVAVKWAENMTARFADLADADPVFAELQNVMDLAVVAAILRKHDLLITAGVSVPAISGENRQIVLPSRTVPQTVSSQSSFARIGNSWMVTTSGGVQVDSWGVLENVQIDNAIASVANRVTPANRPNRLWWNAIN
jgi:hypothetical protein